VTKSHRFFLLFQEQERKEGGSGGTEEAWKGVGVCWPVLAVQWKPDALTLPFSEFEGLFIRFLYTFIIKKAMVDMEFRAWQVAEGSADSDERERKPSWRQGKEKFIEGEGGSSGHGGCDQQGVCGFCTS